MPPPPPLSPLITLPHSVAGMKRVDSHGALGGPASVGGGGGQRGAMSRATSNASEVRHTTGLSSSGVRDTAAVLDGLRAARPYIQPLATRSVVGRKKGVYTHTPSTHATVEVLHHVIAF